MTSTELSKNSFMVGFVVVFVAPFLLGCDSEMKKENSQLKERVVELQHQIDSINSILSMIEKTDEYYYKMAVDARQNENFETSNKFLHELIERFPGSGLGSKAKLMLEQNQKAISKQEEEERKKYSDLELITWSWSTTETGSYVEARGQVKNISGQALRNVEAVVSFYDKKGGFITSGSALIEFNPILVGQSSPFSVLETFNPEMHSATVQFKFLSGETISTYNKSNK